MILLRLQFTIKNGNSWYKPLILDFQICCCGTICKIESYRSSCYGLPNWPGGLATSFPHWLISKCLSSKWEIFTLAQAHSLLLYLLIQSPYRCTSVLNFRFNHSFFYWFYNCLILDWFLDFFSFIISVDLRWGLSLRWVLHLFWRWLQSFFWWRTLSFFWIWCLCLFLRGFFDRIMSNWFLIEKSLSLHWKRYNLGWRRHVQIHIDFLCLFTINRLLHTCFFIRGILYSWGSLGPIIDCRWRSYGFQGAPEIFAGSDHFRLR